MLIETEKTSELTRPNIVALDPLDMRNLDTLRRLRQSQEPGRSGETLFITQEERD
jgi:hypothetical protein